MSFELSEIWIYPIKSTRGFRVAQADVEAEGLAYDRRWMLVDEEGHFMTARTHPQLLQIETQLEDGMLRISSPNQPSIRIPLHPSEENIQDVEIWGRSCKGISVQSDVSEWMSSYIGVTCALVRTSSAQPRQMKPSHVLQGLGHVSFADAFPLLLISEASLEELNRRAGTTLSMERFRPNWVVRGCEPFEEDMWSTFQVGSIQAWGGKLCDRCVLTTIDPGTGQKGREPLATLATFRKWNNRVYFGLNVAPSSYGMVREGDRIHSVQLKSEDAS